MCTAKEKLKQPGVESVKAALEDLESEHGPHFEALVTKSKHAGKAALWDAFLARARLARLKIKLLPTNKGGASSASKRAQ